MTTLLNKKFPPLLQTTPLVADKGIISRQWLDQFTKFSTATFVAITNAQRLAPTLKIPPDGSFALETDTGVLYIVSQGKWQYVSGTRFVLSKDILTLGLVSTDSGYQIYVADLAHGLLWTGTAWQWAPGDAGSGFILPFVSGPSPIVGWQLCDGTANVQRLNGDGSITFETVPNMPGSYYRQ